LQEEAGVELITAGLLDPAAMVVEAMLLGAMRLPTLEEGVAGQAIIRERNPAMAAPAS